MGMRESWNLDTAGIELAPDSSTAQKYMTWGAGVDVGIDISGLSSLELMFTDRRVEAIVTNPGDVDRVREVSRRPNISYVVVSKT